VNSVLEKIYNAGYVEDSEGNTINPFPTATSRETGTILYELIQKYNCQKTLEIGMAYGLSTLFMCQAHQDKGSGHHTTIDPLQSSSWQGIGLLNVERAGLSERFSFLEAFSEEILPQIAVSEERFDFAFIDGMHLFDYALVDFFYVDRLLTTGGYIVFDDIWMPSIREVVRYVLKNRNYQLIKLENKLDLREYLGRLKKRFLESPWERDFEGVKLEPYNICLVHKVAEDKRDWRFHRSF
jgi:predicted O-methyltransferase YrrM